jgi:hypothetical protein
LVRIWVPFMFVNASLGHHLKCFIFVGLGNIVAILYNLYSSWGAFVDMFVVYNYWSQFFKIMWVCI